MHIPADFLSKMNNANDIVQQERRKNLEALERRTSYLTADETAVVAAAYKQHQHRRLRKMIETAGAEFGPTAVAVLGNLSIDIEDLVRKRAMSQTKFRTLEIDRPRRLYELAY